MKNILNKADRRVRPARTAGKILSTIVRPRNPKRPFDAVAYAAVVEQLG